MLRQKSIVGQRRVAAVVAPLALVLSMSISHQALAQTVNCTVGDQVVDGDTVVCGAGSSNAGALDNTGQRTGAGSANSAVRLDTNGASFTNQATGTITAKITTPDSNNYRSDLFGINADGAIDTVFSVTNDGAVRVEHNGIGRAWGIAANGDAAEVTVVNTGTIVAERGAVDITSFKSSGVQAKPSGSGLAANNLRETAGIWAEEEAELLNVTNSGRVEVSGTYSAAIYGRSVLTQITNEAGGEITNAGGVAVGAVSDSNEARELVLTNKEGGKISGDILAVNGHALRWWGLSNGAGSTYGQNLDNRLNINSQAGIENSHIENEGEIDGNIYYSNGEHVLINSGEITGNIDLDQRATVSGAVTNVGARSFTFENSGDFTGNVTVRTQPGSSVVFQPHIFGGAAGSSAAAPSDQSAYIDGTLKIGEGQNADGSGGTGTLADTLTISPVIDSLVKSGEWYLVAAKLDAINVGELPTVENSVLVTWTPSSTAGAGDALAIGATVNDASVVDGLSKPGIATINALMQGGSSAVNTLGGALQNLKDEDKVRVAGEQLKPETNFATQQAAFTLNMLAGNYIDNRLGGVGATAQGAASFASPYGLGMSQTASAAPAGRMSLGLGASDGRMNIGANDGRMDAGIYDKDQDLRGRGYTASFWGQVFGAGLEQNERSNVDGYQTHIYGGLAGADTAISTNTRLGFAAGYGNTSIDGAGDTLRNQTDIDSYFGIVYGAYKGTGWYLSTRASYAYHDYSTKRVVTVPLTDTATASHSGNQYSAAVEVGSPLHYYGATLTPVASLSWSQLDQDAYTEASKAGVGLGIGSQNNTSLASGLGAKALIPIAQDTLIEGRAIWYHEFEDTNQQVTAAFAGGPSFLASGPSVGRDTAALGVGLFAYAQEGVSFQLNYDALLRQDFVGHTGTGRVKVEF